MAESKPLVTLKVQKQIMKFDKGVDPSTGTPFEIVTQEQTLTGEEAQQLFDAIKAKQLLDARNAQQSKEG